MKYKCFLIEVKKPSAAPSGGESDLFGEEEDDDLFASTKKEEEKPLKSKAKEKKVRKQKLFTWFGESEYKSLPNLRLDIS